MQGQPVKASDEVVVVHAFTNKRLALTTAGRAAGPQEAVATGAVGPIRWQAVLELGACVSSALLSGGGRDYWAPRCGRVPGLQSRRWPLQAC